MRTLGAAPNLGRQVVEFRLGEATFGPLDELVALGVVLIDDGSSNDD